MAAQPAFIPKAQPTKQVVAQPTQSISAQEAYEIARDCYVYAYPLVLHEATIRQATNFAEPTGIPGQGPFNQFSHSPAFPPADFKQVVRANVDTLYSIAHLDLGPEPVMLTVPATDRYFMLPMLSLWTDVFAAPGTRTTGRGKALQFLVVGPNWHLQDPVGLEVIQSPTSFVTIGGRTQTNGPEDYENVHKIQASYRVIPVSALGNDEYVPPIGRVDPSIDMKTPPPAQVEQMAAAKFFGRFAELLKDNPPGAFDYPIIHRMERIGFTVGESFDVNAAPPVIKEAFERATADGKELVATLGKKEAGEGTKGWAYTTRGGTYGVDYEYRAAVAYFALGMNLPQDAVYPSISMDGEGWPLDGNNNYVLTFEKSNLPPVDAFWSVTAYDTEGYFISNKLNRRALGDRDKLQLNNDGSLSLYLQADSPGPNKESNWLPVAKTRFTLMMRLYSPRPDVLDGVWTPPPLQRVAVAALRQAG